MTYAGGSVLLGATVMVTVSSAMREERESKSRDRAEASYATVSTDDWGATRSARTGEHFVAGVEVTGSRGKGWVGR